MLEEGKDYVLPTEEAFMETWGSSHFSAEQIFENFYFRLRLVMGPGGPRGRSSREVATKDLTENTKCDTAQY